MSWAQRADDKITPSQRQMLVDRAEEQVKSQAYAAGVDFEKRWPEILSKYQDQIDKATTVSDVTRLLNRALREVGISHLEILPPSVAKDLNKQSIGGIGVSSLPTEDEKATRIMELVKGAPAEKAGLMVGDLIVEVNGKPYANQDQIRGEPGTKVRIKVEREDGSTKEFEITRAVIQLGRTDTLEPVGEDAAVMQVHSFATGYNRAAIEKLFREASKRKYLVIDLRNNGGGDFMNMIHFLSCLLPSRTAIGTQVDREMAQRFAEETGGDESDPVAVAAWAGARRTKTFRSQPVKPFEGKVAVLVNQGSASASEIVAAALRELRGAPLVGTQTAGAVLVSRYSQVGNGFVMKVPLSEWVTINGQRLEGHPLKADVQVRMRRGERGGNEAVEKAIERLRQE